MTPILAVCLTAGTIALSPESPVSYNIEARLDTASHKLTGSEKIEFVNPIEAPLERLCFHLYPNAFKDTSTVFCRENHHIRNDVASGNISRLDVTNITLNGDTASSQRTEQTGTLLYLALPAALLPGQHATISLDFELLIPRARVRFGYDESGNYLFSHCLPILCGFQRGRMIDWEYHSNSEFFSNFSSYDVTLELPTGFEIGATGEPMRISQSNVAAIWHVIADTVIDFAFAAGPAFSIFKTDTLGIKITYLLRSQNASQFQVTDRMTKLALAFDSEKFYHYPYEAFTVVDFPSGSTGMELPGMVVIDFPGRGLGPFRKIVVDLGIAHEITHEWFYATVATNEFEEPWLDEGLTSYVTSRLLADAGPQFNQLSFLGYRFAYDAYERLAGLVGKAEWPIDLRSWDYPDFFSYDAAVYGRAALVYETLEGLVGRAAFDSVMKEFAEASRFRHPTGEDFKSFIAAKTKLDLTRFYAQFIDGTARVDYSVKSLEYNPIRGADTSASRLYTVTVTVGRELDGILPQRLVVGLQGGAMLDTLWDGASRVMTFQFRASSSPVYAAIDTGQAYHLDENFVNNTLYIKSFGSRLLSFEWDLIFIEEIILSLML